MTNKIYIDKNTTIETLQNEFSKFYPFLKIEFFREPHVTGKGSAKNKMIKSNCRLGDIQKIKKLGSLTIDDKSSVSDFEHLFEIKFGLFIQLFRKSGNVWLETSATDNWSLAQQNEEGEMLTRHFSTEKENPEDHDIY